MTLPLMSEALDLIRSGCADTVARERVTIVSEEEIVQRREFKAMSDYFAAEMIFRSACQDAMARTDIKAVKEQFQQLLDAINDCAPGRICWENSVHGEAT